MSVEEFDTVDTDYKAAKFETRPAFFIIDTDGNLIFSGFAHDNLVKRSPMMKMEAKTVQYVSAEPEFKVVGRIAEEWRDCVRLKCYAAQTGPWGSMRHDYIWFDVDKSTWQRLWEFCTQRVNGKPNKCRATIAQNIDFHSQEQVGSNRSASVALSSQNPYLVLGAKGPKLSFSKIMSEEAQFRAKLDKIHQFYASQIKNRHDSHQLFEKMFNALYRYDDKQKKWVHRAVSDDKRYYIEMYLYVCYYLKNVKGGAPTIITNDDLQRYFSTKDQIDIVKALYAQDESRFKELFLSMWEPWIKSASYLGLGAPGDLDVWNHIKNYDNQVLMHDLQRLKNRMQTGFDRLEKAWWNSNRTIDFYDDSFVRQTYRHNDECLKRLLEHMRKQRRLTGDTRNVVEMSIQFLKQQEFHDRRREQGAS